MWCPSNVLCLIFTGLLILKSPLTSPELRLRFLVYLQAEERGKENDWDGGFYYCLAILK